MPDSAAVTQRASPNRNAGGRSQPKCNTCQFRIHPPSDNQRKRSHHQERQGEQRGNGLEFQERTGFLDVIRDVHLGHDAANPLEAAHNVRTKPRLSSPPSRWDARNTMAPIRRKRDAAPEMNNADRLYLLRCRGSGLA